MNRYRWKKLRDDASEDIVLLNEHDKVIVTIRRFTQPGSLQFQYRMIYRDANGRQITTEGEPGLDQLMQRAMREVLIGNIRLATEAGIAQ